MGLTYIIIELINGDEWAFTRKHIIGEEEVKRMAINNLSLEF